MELRSNKEEREELKEEPLNSWKTGAMLKEGGPRFFRGKKFRNSPDGRYRRLSRSLGQWASAPRGDEDDYAEYGS